MAGVAVMPARPRPTQTAVVNAVARAVARASAEAALPAPPSISSLSAFPTPGAGVRYAPDASVSYASADGAATLGARSLETPTPAAPRPRPRPPPIAAPLRPPATRLSPVMSSPESDFSESVEPTPWTNPSAPARRPAAPMRASAPPPSLAAMPASAAAPAPPVARASPPTPATSPSAEVPGRAVFSSFRYSRPPYSEAMKSERPMVTPRAAPAPNAAARPVAACPRLPSRTSYFLSRAMAFFSAATSAAVIRFVPSGSWAAWDAGTVPAVPSGRRTLTDSSATTCRPSSSGR